MYRFRRKTSLPILPIDTGQLEFLANIHPTGRQGAGRGPLSVEPIVAPQIGATVWPLEFSPWSHGENFAG